ncbi:MAG: class I SAM-dependent methyltransferase, partial [Planctomycetota bacterium]
GRHLPASNYAAVLTACLRQFPTGSNLRGGGAALFEDSRVLWALSRFGGVDNHAVLELGPLEGGHSYLLEKAGARSVLAIEANRRCFLKCLITKEIFHLKKVNFLLGDFMPWLEGNKEHFDTVVAAGVLYHMAEPMKLILALGRITDRVYIYTHYIPDDLRKDEPWAGSIVGTEERDGIKHWIKSYGDMGTSPVYCGGVYQSCAWLTKSDIFNLLRQAGFRHFDVSTDERNHPNGPCINFVAARNGLAS